MIKNSSAILIVLIAGLFWSFGPLVVRYIDDAQLIPWQYLFFRGSVIFLVLNIYLFLVEGFKFGHHEKIEVYRAELGKPLLCPEDSKIVAVVTDDALPSSEQTLFRPNDVEGLARFVVSRYQIMMPNYDPT